MKLIEKIKKFKKYMQDKNILYDVLYLTYEYRNIEMDKFVQITDTNIYIIKNGDNVILAVKKPNWKKYIGVSKIWLDDSQGGCFCIHYYKITDNNIEYTCIDNIPYEMINEMQNEFINNAEEIKKTFETLKYVEYYKE